MRGDLDGRRATNADICVFIAVAVVGCYRPSSQNNCAVACAEQDRRCPDDMTCGADFMCHDSNGPACSDAGMLADARSIDASSDAPSGPCFGRGFTAFGPYCLPVIAETWDDLGVVTSSLMADGQAITLIQTNQNACGTFRQSNAAPVCVLAAHNLTLPVGMLQFSGDRPVALIALDTLTVLPNTFLDVGSNHSYGGAGIQTTDCDVATAMGTSGGAGGAWGGAGGAGGIDAKSPSHVSQVGGPAVDPASVTLLRAGCTGHPNGNNHGGQGGGGLYLIAGTKIVIQGKVFAGGGGGLVNSSTAGGGGGGGAGGTIALEAPTVTISPDAKMRAIGGGGAGGNNDTSTNGGLGDDAMWKFDVANGGIGGDGGVSSTGGSGGHGGTSLLVTTDSGGQKGGDATSSNGGAGGGGGGGGDGMIFAFVPGTFAPPAGTIGPPTTVVQTNL